MTKERLRAMAREALEEHTPDVQDAILRRSVHSTIVVWDYASRDALTRIWCACRVAALVHLGQ